MSKLLSSDVRVPFVSQPLGDEQVIPVKPSDGKEMEGQETCLLYTSPSPRDRTRSRMPSSA